jgi:hypothetical protein
MMQEKRRLTLSMPLELHQLLEERAALNSRSVNKEIIFLIEGALAMEIDGNLQILRMLMKASGGLPPAQATTG